MLLIVFAVFNVAVAANESQDQSKNQISSVSIYPQLDTTSKPVSDKTNSTPGNESLNETNCTVPVNITEPSSNSTLNCTNLTETNQSSNQTLNRTGIRNIIRQLIFPVLNDTRNLNETNITGDPLNKFLADVNTLRDKIGLLSDMIRSGKLNISI